MKRLIRKPNQRRSRVLRPLSSSIKYNDVSFTVTSTLGACTTFSTIFFANINQGVTTLQQRTGWNIIIKRLDLRCSYCVITSPAVGFNTCKFGLYQVKGTTVPNAATARNIIVNYTNNGSSVDTANGSDLQLAWPLYEQTILFPGAANDTVGLSNSNFKVSTLYKLRPKVKLVQYDASTGSPPQNELLAAVICQTAETGTVTFAGNVRIWYSDC